MAEWDERAERFSRMQAQRMEAHGQATEMMLELADLRGGNRVLDVAAGTGDQTLLAARRVGPTGYVLAIDISTNMLNVATDAVRKAGLTNVDTRIMDAENLDLDPDTFDAVICRSGLMLFPNPPKALRGMRKVVKPGARVAAIVFSTVEKNPYQGIRMTIARRFDRSGSRVPRLFSLGEPGALENAFREGGFPDVTVRTVSTLRRFPSTAEMIRAMKDDVSGQSMARLSEPDRQQIWVEVEQEMRPFEGPNGCEVPGELLIGVGTK